MQLGPPKVEFLVRPILLRNAMNNSRRYDIFHPSAWGGCPRKIAYQWYNQRDNFFTKTEDDVNLRFERIFDNGHYVHERWQQKYLGKTPFLRGLWKCKKCCKMYGSGKLWGIRNPLVIDPAWECCCGTSELEYEELLVSSSPQYNFEGHVDALIDLRGTPREQETPEYNVFVVDFKTMKDEYYSALTQAKYEHMVQTHIYMWLLKLRLSVVLYENKDNQQIKEFAVLRDESMIRKIKKEAVWMKRVLAENRLPQRPPGSKRVNFPCRFCEFQKICYS